MHFSDLSTSQLDLVNRLISGGDDRLIIDENGLNKYYCSSFPTEVVPFGSCTSSSISNRGWAAAHAADDILQTGAAQTSWSQVLDDVSAEIRRRLKGFLGLDGLDDIDLLLCPSGTDAELIALELVQRPNESILNIVVGPDEVGSGTSLAAAGRHFSSLSPSGKATTKGAPVQPEQAELIEVAEVGLRDRNGVEREPRDIDDEVSRLVEKAIHQNRRVIVHVVAHSKTGVHAPRLPTLNGLLDQYGERVIGLIDAAQGRISRRGLRDYVQRGYLVMTTGSKFYGGPPFCGAVIVPSRFRPKDLNDFRFSPGLGHYLTASELPRAWTGARRGLGDAKNVGLVLRWLTALAEMQAYYDAPSDNRLQVLRTFESETPRILDACPHLEVAGIHEPLFVDEAERLLESKTTVFSMRIRPAPQGQPLKQAELKRWFRLLCSDISRCLPAGVSPSEREIAAMRFHIGQPVIVGKEKGTERTSVLRVALGGSLITDVATDSEKGLHFEERLQWLRQQLQYLTQKFELLSRNDSRFRDMES